MGLFGNSSQAQELYVPVAPKVAFDALLSVASADFTLKSSDDFTLSVVFSSGMSAMTWGENFNAQVVPSGEASTIRLTVTGKANGGGNAWQASKSQKQITAIFASVTAILKAQQSA